VAPYLAGAAPADHPNKRKPGACRGPRLKLLTIVDRAALAAYCQAWGRWVEAENNIQRFGAVIKTPKGLPLVNPYLRIAERAIDQMRKFLVEFGMTPSSRSRIKASDPEGGPSPLQKMLRAREQRRLAPRLQARAALARDGVEEDRLESPGSSC